MPGYYDLWTVFAFNSLDPFPSRRADDLFGEFPIQAVVLFFEISVVALTEADDVSHIPKTHAPGAAHEVFVSRNLASQVQ